MCFTHPRHDNLGLNASVTSTVNEDVQTSVLNHSEMTVNNYRVTKKLSSLALGVLLRMPFITSSPGSYDIKIPPFSMYFQMGKKVCGRFI